MFGFKKPGRVGLRAALLAGATVAALGFGGMSAGSAAASCGGSAIHGEGSTLQKKAQEIWIGTGWHALCPSGPAVTYSATGSGAGLSEWGANNGTTFNTSDDFTATDEAPTESQITNENSATGSNIAVVPVTQAAISIVALPPTGCSISGKINQHNLDLVFEGVIVLWSELLAGTLSESPAGSCKKPLKRVVREEGSGTTYQFKHFLQELLPSALPCLPVGFSGSTWSGLQQDTSGTNPNLIWPEEKNCGLGEGPLSPVITAAGGGLLAKTVTEANMSTEGRIGYAALADAENNTEEGVKAQILEVENGENEALEPTFASPVESGTKNSACKNATYNRPANWATGVNQDWSGAYGSSTTSGGANYPICTLTWDIALEKTSEKFSHGVFLTVEEYFLHLINTSATGGQEDLNGTWYAKLPTPVEEAAEKAVEKIQ